MFLKWRVNLSDKEFQEQFQIQSNLTIRYIHKGNLVPLSIFTIRPKILNQPVKRTIRFKTDMARHDMMSCVGQLSGNTYLNIKARHELKTS